MNRPFPTAKFVAGKIPAYSVMQRGIRAMSRRPADGTLPLHLPSVALVPPGVPPVAALYGDRKTCLLPPPTMIWTSIRSPTRIRLPFPPASLQGICLLTAACTPPIHLDLLRALRPVVEKFVLHSPSSLYPLITKRLDHLATTPHRNETSPPQHPSIVPLNLFILYHNILLWSTLSSIRSSVAPVVDLPAVLSTPTFLACAYVRGV
mmetsp:Transcript_51052/g.84779  ORF Transcript_51052/g.84779 Transcript_51052/m.84779 type:complete len:206 (+) Transcript_51052:1001-1618(+)